MLGKIFYPQLKGRLGSQQVGGRPHFGFLWCNISLTMDRYRGGGPDCSGSSLLAVLPPLHHT